MEDAPAQVEIISVSALFKLFLVIICPTELFIKKNVSSVSLNISLISKIITHIADQPDIQTS